MTAVALPSTAVCRVAPAPNVSMQLRAHGWAGLGRRFLPGLARRQTVASLGQAGLSSAAPRM